MLEQLAIAFEDGAAYQDHLDNGRARGQDYRGDEVGVGGQAEAVGGQDQEIGLFAGAQGTGHLSEPEDPSAVDGGQSKDVSRGEIHSTACPFE